MKTTSLPVACLLVALVGPAMAGPGSPDPSFGGTGYATGPQLEVTDVVVQGDGAVLTTGTGALSGGGAGFVTTRHLADGTLDPSFDGDGVVETPIGSGIPVAQAIALLPDGRIVVGGFTEVSFFGSYDYAVVRYLSDGSLDPSFGGDGKVTTDLGHYDVAYDVAVQPDGKIVLVGSYGGVPGGAFGVVRYLEDGSLDPSFDGDGIAITDLGGIWALGVAIQSDGKLVVVGLGPSGTGVAVRYLPDGALDPAFGSGGVVLTDVTSDGESAQAVAIQSDGRIVVAGGIGGEIGVLRYLDAGTLDPSFGTGGIVRTPVGSAASAESVAIQTDGRIVVSGSATIPDALYTALAAVRYEPDGTIESGFGVVSTRILAQPTEGHSVALAPGGKIVAVGEYGQPGQKTSFVVRYGTLFPVCWDGVVEGSEQCDDGNYLDGDCCSSTCQLDPMATPCAADTDPCTTDLCDGSGTCLHDSGNDGAPCDDGDVCTIDLCEGGSCVGAAVPRTTCREPFVARRGNLLIRDNANPKRDIHTWRWLKGEATSQAEFAQQDYALCVFDESAAPQPVARIETDGNECGLLPCWQPRGQGQIYTDISGTHDGLRQLYPLASTTDGDAALHLRARGENLSVPQLPLTPPVTVQLHDSTGLCWSAGYGSPSRNDTGVFRAKAD